VKTYEGRISLAAWTEWWAKHYEHKQFNDVLGGNVHWMGLRHVKEAPQMALKILAGRSPLNDARVLGIVIYIPSGKTTLYQKLTQAFKLCFGFFNAHVQQPTTGELGKKAEVAA